MRRKSALKFKISQLHVGFKRSRIMDLPKPSLDTPPYTPPSFTFEIEGHHKDERNEDQIPEETTAKEWIQPTENNLSDHTETETSSVSEPDDLPHSPQTCSVEAVAKSGSATSIYLDNGVSDDPKPSKPPQPQKRLTMAQRATMEALASFGGTGLGSVEMKKRDLKSELKREAERVHTGEESQPRSRKTRLQAARQEAMTAFQDIALGGEASGRRKGGAPGKTTSTEGGVEGSRYITRAERARREAYEAFGGVPLDSLPVTSTRKRKISETEVDPSADPDCPSAKAPRCLSRTEMARLEALQSFGGGGLGDVLSGAKRRVARTLEAKSKGEQGELKEKRLEEGKENQDTAAA